MRSVKILIVDDHPAVRNGVRSLLSTRSEWTVCGEAREGYEAVEKAKSSRPDIVLMDISMPRMDGLEATRIIRREIPETEVIIISQNDTKLVSRQTAEVGAREYIAKADLGRDLLQTIDKIIKQQLTNRSAAHDTIKPRERADVKNEPPTGQASDSPAAIHSTDTESSLANSQMSNLLAAIVDSSDDAIISKNLDGIITSWNKSAQRIFGYSAEEAIGKHITLIIPEDRREEEISILARLRRGERVDHFQTVRIRKDGTTLDVSLTISPVRDSAGRVIGASKVARDITTQTRVEQALRESEERFRAIVDTTPECVALIAPDGTLLHMNLPGLEMVSAHSAEDVIGKNIYDLIAPEDRDKFRAFNKKICAGIRGSLEFDIVGLKGRRLRMEMHAAPLQNPDGSIVQLGISRDVTERKRAEERERKISAEAVAAQAKFRAVFEQTTQFAGIMTKDGRLIDANKLCLEACGYRAEEVLGRLFWETAWWRKFPESQTKIRTATPRVAEGVPYREILNYSLADGTERLVDFALYPIVDEQGLVLFLHPTGVDITDLKRAEENYRKLAETLEAEVRARTVELENRNVEVLRQSELLREFSQRLLQAQDEERRHIARELHDSAGQTLTVLGINLSQLIQKAGRNAPNLAADAEKIQEQVQQLHREIRTASYLLHPPLLDETGLPSALSWYVQGLGERSGLDITLDISKEVGRLPHHMELVVFRLVQECLTNIHRHSGSKTAVIKIARTADMITVEVRDQGKGMSPAKLTDIQSKGSGVGIRGMRERVRQFAGNVNIESDAAGTRIFVTIPIPKIAVPEERNGIKPLPAAV